jgi:hypothetical protein
MSATAVSILAFGIYLVMIGTGFLLIPNTILPLFKFPKTNEPWIRVLGSVVLVLGFYYIISAQNELTPFFWATVVGRFGILVLFVLLVVSKEGPTSTYFVWHNRCSRRDLDTFNYAVVLGQHKLLL